MIHEGHDKPVWGCPKCIEVRGPLEKPLTGRVHELRDTFKTINMKLEKRMVDDDYDQIIDWIDKIERLIDDVHTETEELDRRELKLLR